MRYLVLPPPPPRKYVHYLRMAAWNAAFIIGGLLLTALAGELYFRLTKPIMKVAPPSTFVDGVGRIRMPNAEMRDVNWNEDHYVVSRANSQGFIDREPLGPESAAGCYITFIGDSFVEARQVPIADKFHVRLEEMASRELPHLDIATQAYGIGGTGQINQLPFYDEYARHLSPKLVVLVFYINDFRNNSIVLQSLIYGHDPDKMPYMSAQRDGHGELKLRPPDPEYDRFRLPHLPKAWYVRWLDRLARTSYFVSWMDTKKLWHPSFHPQFLAWRDMLAERPCCASLRPDVGQPSGMYHDAQFRKESLPPVLEEALEYTAFGIDQFKQRADRDGVRLIILSATGDMGTRGDPQFDRLSAIAEARGIPVISHYDYMIRQRYDEADGQWRNDPHWNATGHQWVAESVLEWLKANQNVCD